MHTLWQGRAALAGAHSCRYFALPYLLILRSPNCSVFKAKIEEQPCIVKVFKSSEITPLWRLVREARPACPCPTATVCTLNR